MTEQQEDYAAKSDAELLEIIGKQREELDRLRGLQDKDLAKAYAEQGKALDAANFAIEGAKAKIYNVQAESARMKQMLAALSDAIEGAQALAKGLSISLNQIPRFKIEEPPPNA